MSMPFSQVTFTLQPKAKFGRLAGLIQKRVRGRQYAVSDCEVDEEARSVQCRWKRSVGYKSVQSWIGQALGDSDAEFALRCILETDVGKGDQAHPERPRQPSLALPAPSLGRLAEVDAADALAAHAKAAASPAPSLARPAEFEAAVAPAAPAKAEATSAAYEVQSGPVSKRLCLPAPASASGALILSHAWLPVKAFELDRGADIDPKAKSKFVKLTDISSGTFGITERAIDETTNRVVVLKRLRTQPADKKGKENDTRDSSWEFHHEVFLLTQLRHENIVQLLDVFVHPYTLVLADAGTDLQEHVKQFGSLEEWPAALVARQVAAGIGHKHALRPKAEQRGHRQPGSRSGLGPWVLRGGFAGVPQLQAAKRHHQVRSAVLQHLLPGSGDLARRSGVQLSGGLLGGRLLVGLGAGRQAHLCRGLNGRHGFRNPEPAGFPNRGGLAVFRGLALVVDSIAELFATAVKLLPRKACVALVGGRPVGPLAVGPFQAVGHANGDGSFP